MSRASQKARIPCGRKVINVQQLLGLPDSTPNPHLWCKPTTMPAVACAVAAGIAQLDPAHASHFKANAASFTASLSAWSQAIAAFKAAYRRSATTASRGCSPRSAPSTRPLPTRSRLRSSNDRRTRPGGAGTAAAGLHRRPARSSVTSPLMEQLIWNEPWSHPFPPAAPRGAAGGIGGNHGSFGRVIVNSGG